jgi:hypothetical protein
MYTCRDIVKSWLLRWKEPKYTLFTNQKWIKMALRKFTEEQVQEAKSLRAKGLSYATGKKE